MKQLTPAEVDLRDRYLELHEALDVLAAQFMTAFPERRPSTITVLDLLEWSAARIPDPPWAAPTLPALATLGDACAWSPEQYAAAMRELERLLRIDPAARDTATGHQVLELTWATELYEQLHWPLGRPPR